MTECLRVPCVCFLKQQKTSGLQLSGILKEKMLHERENQRPEVPGMWPILYYKDCVADSRITVPSGYFSKQRHWGN